MTSSFNSLLVAVDFSDPSRQAFQQALKLLSGDSPAMIVLHVIDQDLVDLMVASELFDSEQVITKLRQRRQEELREFTDFGSGDMDAKGGEAQDAGVEGVDVKGIVSVGIPFLEIIRKAEEFAVDAIVMGKVGAGDRFDKLLFGSTAERVLRGSLRPVVVFPSRASSEPTVFSDARSPD